MGQGPSAPRRPHFDELGRFSPELQDPTPNPNFLEQARATIPAPQTAVQAAPAAAGHARAPVTAVAEVQAASPAPTSVTAPAAAQVTSITAVVPAATAPVAAQPSASQSRSSSHKSTTLIPGWSRSLSSQALQIECQKVHQVQRQSGIRDNYGVLELEVMKYIAYCGGVTIKFRIDELQYGPVDNVCWGLASTRACPALLSSQQPSTSTVPATDAGSPSASRVQDPKAKTGKPNAQPITVSNSPTSKTGATTGVPVDSVSRKPLYMICSTSTHRTVSAGDILTIDLAPREDKQPVIMATLKLNDVVLLQSSLPCSTISSLQMHPFVTVLPGMYVSLHEAITPSPLYTWFSPTLTGASETQFCELDTCVKYHTPAATATTLQTGSGQAVEFQGSTIFASGRQRWTVQLDNYSAQPTHIYVGVVAATHESSTTSTASILANVAGPLRSIAGTSSAPTATAAAAAGQASTSAAAAGGDVVVLARPHSKWGAWVRLPGTNAANNHNPNNPHVPAPPKDGLSHLAESTSAHCFITVDLDLTAGYVRFFRNGHLIGSAFTGVHGPVSPTISFVQAPSLNCQAGLVNLTKLKQLDLKWNPDKCSGDLRLSKSTVGKGSEIYGDYSTVLANQGFISGMHLWLIKVNNLSEPDSIFIGVCRGCMPLDQDPQDLRDRTYYLSNGVIRVGGRRVATNSANFTKGDTVGVVLDADQGEVVFFRNGIEMGRARGIRGRLYPFVSCDSEGDQITLLGSYSLQLNRIPRQLADMEWDTLHHGSDLELSSNCLTATKTNSLGPSTVRGTILYSGSGVHEFHVILDTVGPDGVWVGLAPPNMDSSSCVGDTGCGWALHSDGDKRVDSKEEEFTQAFKSGDVLTVCVNLSSGSLRFSRNGTSLGEAFCGITGPLVAAVTLASEESKVTIQNRPTVLNTGEYTGALRWDEARAGKDLHVIDGLTVTKMSNEGGDYATVLGTLCLASGQHSWNIYINHVEDSNLFIGVTVGGHDLNADPQEMKHRTYYLSNGTIRVAGKLVTRCAEPYAEGDLITVQLDMEQRHIAFLKNGVLQGAGDGLPDEVWPYVSLDNIMDSITLHSSNMFVDLVHSLRWNPQKASRNALLIQDGQAGTLRPSSNNLEETVGQATVLGLREYCKTEVHSWIVRFEQNPALPPANFLVGVAPPNMELNRSLGEENCGIGLDYYGYFYVNGRYFHASNLSNWHSVSKLVRGSTAKHKGKAAPIFVFTEGKCEVTVTLDLKDATLKFSHNGRSIGTIAGVKGPLHAAVTITSSKQTASLAPGPMGKSEHTNEELVGILKAKGCPISPKLEAALLCIPRDLFVPRDRHREAFRDQKVTVRMMDGSTMTMPPPSFAATALEKLALGPTTSFLDVGCGTAYVTALAACLIGPSGTIHGIECVSSRLETARSNMKQLKERMSSTLSCAAAITPLLGDPVKAIAAMELNLSNVLIPECTDGVVYDAIYCDASLSEEDLPTFLSLLKPSGRMVIVIEEEALLVTRSADPHDFSREVVTHVTGDFGELEDPTPWEVQEAILRIKEREKRKGADNARSEMASLRSFEYTEMQQRMVSAMNRINELESNLARSGSLGEPSLRSPMRDPRSPTLMASVDDVRVVMRDKTRRSLVLKQSPRGSGRMASPTISREEWRDKFGTDSSRGRANNNNKDPLDQQDQLDGDTLTHVSMPQTTFDDIIDGMGVQMFSSEQIDAMLSSNATPVEMDSYELYQGTFKGVKVRLWKVHINHSVSFLELKRAYSKYCIAHPNITAVLGVCVQQCSLDSSLDSSDELGPEALLSSGTGMGSARDHVLWVVEESFGEETLHTRLERGLLGWQQLVKIAADISRALAFLQDLRQRAALAVTWSGGLDVDSDDEFTGPGPASDTLVLSAYALRTIVTPSNVQIDAQSTKVSMLPVLLNHLESVVADVRMPPTTPLHSDMAYSDPNTFFADSASPSFYALGVVLLQLLTEQGALGLLSAVKEALMTKTLLNLIPRLPATPDMQAWAESFAHLAIKLTQPGGINSLEAELLPALEELGVKLTQLGSSTMSWEQVEEMLMLPLQPRTSGESANRRWVRQDFRMRRKMFLQEVAKLAVEGPVHKLEVRRSRCFKDSAAVFCGKGHTVWRQPLKVTFIGEAGMDSGGVTREWFSTLSSAISRGSPELFWSAGPQRNQLYLNPMSSSPAHLKKFGFVGLFMAKAILETAARGKELGPVTLSLSFCEPFWKLLLGMPLNLMDLQLLDPTEFRSLMSILNMDIDGLIFENFSWNFQHPSMPSAPAPPPVPALPLPGADSETNTPTASIATTSAAASPFACDFEDSAANSIPLKPGGKHVKVTNHNKREYVLLKAHKMLVGAVESQMSAIIDAFHSLIPRDLVDKYQFTSLEMQLLVCGEQRIDIQDLKRHCKYEDGYSGKEDVISWFWEVVDTYDDDHRRQLLQFWSGSDGMPAEGFGFMDPAFHMVAVERLYDANDTTARLPAAHTCFRQLDLPRYRSREELKEKLLCAITIGQGYMALS